MGVRYDRTRLVKVLSEYRNVTGQVHSDVITTSLCFFSRPMPAETDDVSGCGLRSNESLMKETVECCYTCDQQRPRKITKVKVIVLLQTFYFLGHFYSFPPFVFYLKLLSVSQII
jgi:hypothetical protein